VGVGVGVGVGMGVGVGVGRPRGLIFRALLDFINKRGAVANYYWTVPLYLFFPALHCSPANFRKALPKKLGN
jgi:hypothetical protein